MEKKHKLLLVTPSGEEIKLGYLIPTRNGFVLGASQVEGTDTSHLTIIPKGKTLSSHITPQKHQRNRRYFPQVNLEDFAKAFQERVEQGLVSPLTTDQISEDVVYVTQKLFDLLDLVKDTLYEERTSTREVIHVLNFKKLLGILPQLIEGLKNFPSSFLGMCKAKEILDDPSKILGLTNSKLFVIPIENQLYLADFSFIVNFNPLLKQEEVSSPLSDIYEGIGISQYMQEVKKKGILEKLLSKANEKL